MGTANEAFKATFGVLFAITLFLVGVPALVCCVPTVVGTAINAEAPDAEQ